MSHFSIWKIIVGTGIVVSLVTGIIKYDERFAKCQDVERNFQQIETKIAKTLDQFQKNMDIRHYDYLSESILRDYYNCKIIEKRNPELLLSPTECEDLKDEYERIREKKRELVK